MKMHNPPHPGEILKELWLNPVKISITDAAKSIGVSRKTLSNIINKKSRITPETAVRLSISIGSSPESWLGHQTAYDLWQIEQRKEKLNSYPISKIGLQKSTLLSV
ncbi:MAG: HigA family addiction module antidote protein [Deltaproteobacteria bacterium]|nr:HigA family addiction module antidote protein [Deltaproteobacteria bacterium]